MTKNDKKRPKVIKNDNSSQKWQKMIIFIQNDNFFQKLRFFYFNNVNFKIASWKKNFHRLQIYNVF